MEKDVLAYKQSEFHNVQSFQLFTFDMTNLRDQELQLSCHLMHPLANFAAK